MERFDHKRGTRTKHRFRQEERYAVWRSNGKTCFWCENPLRLVEATVDHLIPEMLLDRPDELRATLEQFDLTEDFEINSYANWVPMHHQCNIEKGTSRFPPTPQNRELLRRRIRGAEEAKGLADGVRKDARKDVYLGKVLVALDTQSLTLAEIVELLKTGPVDPEM